VIRARDIGWIALPAVSGIALVAFVLRSWRSVAGALMTLGGVVGLYWLFMGAVRRTSWMQERHRR